MLELGRSGTYGTRKGMVPVLHGGAVVATLHASGWRETATAHVGERSWVFGKSGGQLTGREATDPEGTVRLRARRGSWLTGAWQADLEGVLVEVSRASAWKGTHRYSVAGRQVAESGTTGGWSRRLTLSADASLPLHALVFLLWFELVISRRNDGAAAAAI